VSRFGKKSQCNLRFGRVISAWFFFPWLGLELETFGVALGYRRGNFTVLKSREFGLGYFAF